MRYFYFMEIGSEEASIGGEGNRLGGYCGGLGKRRGRFGLGSW